MGQREDQTIDELRAALAHPDASIKFTHVFGHGRAAQVYVKSRKIGPFILPSEGQTIADVLHMLGVLALPEGQDAQTAPPVTSLAEEGRRLASEREDLIALGVDPADLVIPTHPGDVQEPDDGGAELALAVGRAVVEAVERIPYERDDYSEEYTWRVAGEAALRVVRPPQ